MTREELLAFRDRGHFTEQEFSTELGLVQVDNRVCVRRLLGESPKHGPGNPRCDCADFSWLDHPIAFRDNFSPEGSVDVIAWCPYSTWEEYCKQHTEGYAGLNIFDFARKHGLHIEEFPRGSGWYGYHTVFVVLWRGD